MRILFLTERSDNHVGVFNNHGFEMAIGELADCKWAGLGWSLHRINETIDATVNRVMPDAEWVVCPRETLIDATKVQARTCIMITDLHGKWNWKLKNPWQFALALREAEYDLVFSRYLEVHGRGEDPKMLQNMLGEQFRWLPWSMDPRYYYAFKGEYNYDVALMATIGIGAPHLYPLRVDLWRRLPDLCKTYGWRNLIEKAPNTQVWESNIAEMEVEGLPVGRNYVFVLNRTRALPFGNSKFRYPLQRNFEARAAGGLVLSDTPVGAEALGFKDGVDYVEINRQTWEEKLSYYLENWDEGAKIAERGRTLFLERHTHEIRAREFLEMLNKT